jgi:hypothetical protein
VRDHLGFAAVGVGACIIASVALTPPVNGQSKALRLSDGTPNLSGVWVNTGFKRLGGGMLERFPSTGLPFQPAGADLWNVKLNGDPHHDEPMFYAAVNKEGDFGCRPPGIPQASLTANAQQFLQTPGYLLIIYEGIHSARMIPMDGRSHAPDLEPTFLGDSVGRYEGDTAVVDTVAIRPGLSDAGGHHMHSEGAHYIERYRRTGPTAMSFELTTDDQKVFTKPWVSGPWKLELHPEWTIVEGNCEDVVFGSTKRDVGLLDYLHHAK